MEKWAKAHFFVCNGFVWKNLAMAAPVHAALVDRLTNFGEKAAAGTPIEIVEVQLRGAGKARLLRVYIDKPGGVTHGDCELISERLGKLLDEDDSVPGDSYTLEVSSLGLERTLSKPRDFERVIGQKISLALGQPIAGQTRLEGKLNQISGETLALQTEAGIIEVPLGHIHKAKLKFEW